MEMFRSLLKRINNHPILSALVVFFIIGTLYIAKIASERNTGKLTDPIQKGTVVDSVYGIGTVTANHSYSIKPGVIQTIKYLYVKEGDLVKKGAKLLTIDNVDYRAPFDGVISSLPFNVGENVFAQTPALVLMNIHDRYLVVTLVQQGALRVKPGQKVILSFDSIRHKKYYGIVQSVYPYNGNFLARIDVSNLPPEILPDMTADVAIIIQEINDALIIPVTALENNSVWVKRPHGLSTKVDVKIGVVDDVAAQIISGDIKVGDQLIIRKKVGL